MSSGKEAKDLQGQRGYIPYVHTCTHALAHLPHMHTRVHTHTLLVSDRAEIHTPHHPPFSHHRLQPPMIFKVEISRITTK